MKKKSLLLLGASLGVLALGLAGCGGAKNEDSGSADGKTKISFTWWGAEVRHEKYIKAIEAFEKENPDIDVEYEYASWDDYWKKLATKSAAGELPDVMQMDGSYLAQYGEKNQLADLTEFTGDGKTIDTSEIDESIIDSGKLGDKFFAIAPAVNAMSMITNKALTDKAGATLDYENYTFEDWVGSIDKVKKETDEYGMIDVVDNYVLLQYYLRTQGEELLQYNKDGKPELAFTKENFVTFMDEISKLAKSKAIPTAEVASNIKSFDENPLSLGKVAYYQNWNNQYVTYTQSAADGVEFSLELPYDAKDGALFYRPSFFYSVAQSSKHKEAAAKFADFLVNNEEANKIIGTERGIPASNAAKETIYDDMTDEEKVASDYLDKIADYVGEASPVLPVGFSELNTHFKELFAEITYGTMTPEETYESYTAKAKEIFDENYD
ncbi:ABC transporter substrate-binding protein [Enterococcus sp. JM9B]|uniref:ABC transporter substrate-binding protein n=1 Tax=Enterococcus sp. JM9B TaxID=1857216 RepID=UPI001F2D8391|nr:ABC transporter substrate-binding protein [Enterococcus sp. JM9B]